MRTIGLHTFLLNWHTLARVIILYDKPD